MVVRFALLLLLFGALSPIPTLAQDANSVQRGRTVAERRCAACHAVRAGEGASPNAAAPTFARVATTPESFVAAARAILASPVDPAPLVAFAGRNDWNEIARRFVSICFEDDA